MSVERFVVLIVNFSDMLGRRTYRVDAETFFSSIRLYVFFS